MRSVAVIDFETTGLRPGPCRVIEVGALIIRDGIIVDRFESLMNPGFPIPVRTTQITGITTDMVRDCPLPQAVMPKLRAFLGDHSCIAHNAAFDKRFFDAEMALANQSHERAFLCSMRLAKRLIPRAPKYKLVALSEHLQLSFPPGMQAHRAPADAHVTAELWNHLLGILRAHLGGRDPDQEVIESFMCMPRKSVDIELGKLAAYGSASVAQT